MIKLDQGFVWAPYHPMIVMSPNIDFIDFSVVFDDEVKLEAKKINKTLNSILELENES